MGGAPAPGLIRHPGPADDRIPGPTTVIIGPPVGIIRVRDPDVAVLGLIDPAAVIGELDLVIGVVGREVSPVELPGEDGVPGRVPVAKLIAPGDERFGRGEQPAVRGRDLLAAPDDDRAFLARGFGRTAKDREFGLPVLPDLDPVEAAFKDIKRDVRRMDFEILLSVQGIDPDEAAAGEEMELGQVAVPAGKGHDVHLGVFSQPEIVAPAELELDPPVLCPNLVTFEDDDVQLPLLIARVLPVLDVDVPLDEAHPGVASAVVAFRALGGNEGGEHRRQNRRDQDCFSHRFSPSAYH
jgi:hypothetical protein